MAERFRDDEVESLLLGAVFSDPAAIAAARARLAPGDFGLSQHGTVWAWALEAFDAGRPLDVAALRAHLRARNCLAAVESVLVLDNLPYLPADLERVDAWVAIVAANARARETLRALARAAALGQTPDLDAGDFVARARDLVAAAADERADPADECWMSDDAEAFYREIADANVNGPKRVALDIGMPRLTKMTGGLCAGQVFVLAGRTGYGKTAAAVTLAVRAATRNRDGAVLFASLEMTRREITVRGVSMLTEIEQSRLRFAAEKPLPDAEIEQARKAGPRLERIRLLSRGTLSVADIRASARRLQLTTGLSLVIVDYLQLIQAPVGKNDTREREVAQVSRGLKQLALDLRVPVLAISQFNRKADERAAEERPTLADLRESGAIAHDATAVVFLWPHPDKRRVRLVVAKSRHGKMGELSVGFTRPFTRLETDERTELGGPADAHAPETEGPYADEPAEGEVFA